MGRITIIPIGDIDSDILNRLRRSLRQTFGLEVEIGAKMEQPDYACDSERGQYNSAAILTALGGLQVEKRILGVADVDLYLPELNFVFGQADSHLGLALISLSRLRPEYYGLPRDDGLLRERVVKEAVHELGHTYDLRHCPNKGCVMHFSDSLEDTDRKKASFCQNCWSRLREPI